jgi:methylmalonyl-CoA mutase cobalamin-binding subunit
MDTTPAAPPRRFVTAASLFDGHDAAINIIRRMLQASGAEVIHLGHDRSVDEVVRAALEEDVHGVALSSYQGGHVEYLSYLVERLREKPRPRQGCCGRRCHRARDRAAQSRGHEGVLARRRAPSAWPG